VHLCVDLLSVRWLLVAVSSRRALAATGHKGERACVCYRAGDRASVGDAWGRALLGGFWCLYATLLARCCLLGGCERLLSFVIVLLREGWY
jgi:hypothetical protein